MNVLDAVACPTTSDCTATGTSYDASNNQSGAVVASTDGGATWSAQTVPSGAAVFNGVACPTVFDCTAVGATYGDGNGVVIATTDQGSTWKSQTVPAGLLALDSVSCLNSSDCTADGIGSGSVGAVMATTDGGATWTAEDPPAGGRELAGLACPDSSVCVAVGQNTSSRGLILTSADGGATWSAATMPPAASDLGGISCPSSSACVAVGGDSAGAAAYATSDDGTTWTEQTIPSPARFLYQVSCATASDCVAVGSGTSATGTATGVVVATSDGGATWTAETIPDGSYQFFGVSCPTATDCLAVGGTSSGQGMIIATTDGGTTWSAQTLPANTRTLDTVSCPTTSDCFVDAYASYSILATTDGGANWSALTLPSGVSFLSGISCPSALDCTAVGDGEGDTAAAIATTDGGASWTSESLPADVEFLDGVWCPSTTVCAGVGGNPAGGSAVLSTDGGQTWVDQTVPSQAGEVLRVACSGPLECAAVASGTDGPLILESSRASTTTTASADPGSSGQGQSVTYGASVTATSGSGTPTGSVSFTVGTTALCTAPLTAGSGSCSATDAPAGADTVTASYSGDTTFAPSTGTTTETVADTTAPVFPGGATLSVSNVTATSLHLAWPAATDNVGVTAYQISEDGAPLTTVNAATTSYDVSGLAAQTTYSFDVAARDAAGNTSANLTATATTSAGGVSPGDNPLIATPEPGGMVSLRWDPDPSTPSAYRILRDDGSGLAEVADVDSATTTFTDTGRLAQTSYSYQVDLVDAGGSASPWTKEVTVTTPALTIGATSAALPMLAGTRVAALGGSAGITLQAEPDRTATATIAYLARPSAGAAPVAGSATVALTEDPADPGNYGGGWTIPEGTTQVTSVTGTLSDGDPSHAVTSTAPGLPVDVSGALKVTIDKPASGTLTGAILSLISPSSGTQEAVDGGQTVTLPLAAAAAYTLSLDEPATYAPAPGFRLDSQTGIPVASGTTGALEVAQVMPGFLDVTVQPATVPSSIEVYGPDGNLLASGSGGPSPSGPLGPLTPGTAVTVDTILPTSAAYQTEASQTVTVAAGDNTVTIDHPALPTGTIAGTITLGADGVSAHVTATEMVAGRTWTYATDTSDNGTYSLDVLAGDATVAVAGPFNETASKSVTVTAGGTAGGDVALSDTRPYLLEPSLVTQDVGGAPTTLALDWRASVHFDATLTGPGNFRQAALSSPTSVNGLPR